MKILIYYPGDLNRTTGTPIRTLKIIRSLSDIGADVCLLADRWPPSLKNIKCYQSGGRVISRMMGLLNAIRKEKPDLIYGQSHTSLYAVALASLISRVPRFFDLHNDYCAECFFEGWKKVAYRAAEKICLKRARGITAASQPLKDFYGDINVPLEVIWGGTDSAVFNPAVGAHRDIVQLRRENSIVVSYIGNFRAYQGTDILLEAARLVAKKDSRFLFVLIGGDEDKKLSGNIVFIKQRQYEKIPAYLAAADILVIPRPANDITIRAFPSKLPEYMAMGKAIVCTDVGDASQLIKSGETGILIQPGDVNSLVEAILRLEDGNLRDRLGKGAREFVCANNDWKILSRKIYRFFQDNL